MSRRALYLLALCAVLLSGCSFGSLMPFQKKTLATGSAPQQRADRQAADQEGVFDPKTRPYVVFGRTYYPLQSAHGYREEGTASWYGKDFHGKRTASGEVYDMYGVSAAHKLLPLGTKVRVTNLGNGRDVVLVVNDRGPFVDGRIIDLSLGAARRIGSAEQGLALVRVEAITEPTPDDILPRPSASGPRLAEAKKPGRSKVEREPAELPAQRVVQEAIREAASLAGEPVRQKPAPALAEADGAYFVQVGAFSINDNAERVRGRLVKSGYAGARVKKTLRQGREYYVVQAVFRERGTAEQALRDLRQEFPASFLVS